MLFAWDVGSSVSFNECLLLSQLATGRDVLEIGSWLGRSTIALASTAKSVTTVDWHQGDEHSGTDVDTLPGLIENLARYRVQPKVTVVVGRVEAWAESMPDDDLYDGVFIDGAHDPESVRRDWEIASRLCIPGGWIAFHDYGVEIEGFGVTEFVDSLGLACAAVDSIVVVRNP